MSYLRSLFFNNIMTDTSFTSLGLPQYFDLVLEEQKYSQPYPIQEQVIPIILNGRDVLGIAQTGSGKTAGYVLPILTKLGKSKTQRNRHIDVLVMVPTRELAEQVKDVFQTFSVALPQRIKCLAVYGGVSINPQMLALQGTNVLVATPGRLLDLIESNAVNLDEIHTLVLDEADKMLNLGFEDEMKIIFGMLPLMRQNLLFSATLNDNVKEIKQFLLNAPKVVKIEPKKETTELIDQVAYTVSEDRKGPFLRELITGKNMQRVLVFTASSYKADNVANKLRKNGISASAIHGKKTQSVRMETLEKFKSGEVRVLVSTDLLARGIDIELLPYVINYELPRSPKDYVHRIGRTGRAESKGQAITFITPEDEHHFKIIQKKMGKQVARIESEGLDLSTKKE